MKHHELLLKTSRVNDNICTILRNFLRTSTNGSLAHIYIEDKLHPQNNFAFGTAFFLKYRPYLQGFTKCGSITFPVMSNQFIATEHQVESFFDASKSVLQHCVEEYTLELKKVLNRFSSYATLLNKVTVFNYRLFHAPSDVYDKAKELIEFLDLNYVVEDTDGKKSYFLSAVLDLRANLTKYISEYDALPKTQRKALDIDPETKLAIRPLVDFSVESSAYLSDLFIDLSQLGAFKGKNGLFNVFNPQYPLDSLDYIDKQFNDIRSYIKIGRTVKPLFDAKISALFNQLTTIEQHQMEVLSENISGLRSIVILNELGALYVTNLLSGQQASEIAIEMYRTSISSYYRLSNQQEYLAETVLHDQVQDLLKDLTDLAVAQI